MKPPYQVPSMTEINALPWNGFSVASTFAGCGGSSLGYRLAGFKVLYANEFVEEARNTYASNARPSTFLDDRDIRDVTADDVLSKIGKKVGELDVLDGSPPCSSFSMSGKRAAGWGKEHAYSDDQSQRTDDLFFEYARLLEGIQPRVFVAENVTGLVRGVAKGYFKLILARLSNVGYQVQARIVDASYLGVPQSRKRLIFVGVRNDLGGKPVHPKPLGYRYSLREAIAGLDSPWSNGQAFDPETGERIDIDGTALGREFINVKAGKGSNKYLNLSRATMDLPVPTVTAMGGSSRGTASVTHQEPRKFTIPELRRLCSFPDDFVLTGSYAQRWERLGRSVPPVMMGAIASTIRDEILGGSRV